MKLLVAISNIDDGNMLIHGDKSNSDVIENRKAFLDKNSIDINHTTRVSIAYDGDNYCRYFVVSDNQKAQGMFGNEAEAADGLVTQSPNHALFLPLADCVGAVIFDPEKNILMVSHLGRHSLEQNGGQKSIDFLVKEFGCDPNKLCVWLTPSAGKENYPLYSFGNRSMDQVATEQLLLSGVIPENIHGNPTDTTKDLQYFSHSEFIKGNRSADGRFAVVAMMQN